MRTRHRLLKLVLLAGLALPAAALATDPLNGPPSQSDPVNSAPPRPKSSTADTARAAQESVVTSASVMEDARKDIAASREEARRNLDAGVRGQTPPVRTTGTQQGPSQAAVRATAEEMGVFDGLDAEERAAAERAIANMPVFETADDETQRAIDGMSVFGEECEDPDFSDQKARVRAGLVQGQQYGQQNEAGLRAAAQATGIQAYADLADKLEKKRLAYSNIDERVEGVGGTNGCKPEPKPKPPKTPGSKGPKAPKPPAAQGPKTPEGGSGPAPSEPQSSPQRGEAKSAFHELLVQAEEAEDKLKLAQARLAEAEKQYREAIARGEQPRTPEDVANLPAEIAALKDRVAFLNRQLELATPAPMQRGPDDIRERFVPGLTPQPRPERPSSPSLKEYDGPTGTSQSDRLSGGANGGPGPVMAPGLNPDASGGRPPSPSLEEYDGPTGTPQSDRLSGGANGGPGPVMAPGLTPDASPGRKPPPDLPEYDPSPKPPRGS